jgi:hypothetical protein
MDIKELQQVLNGTIKSDNGVLTLDFTFDYDNGGLLNVYDNQLEVQFQIGWEFKSFNQMITITLKANQNVKVIGYLSQLRQKIAQMESAYDVVGE